MFSNIPEEIIQKVLLLLGVFVFLAYTGTQSFEDAKEQEATYIEFVCKNFYPNYKKWDIDCNQRKLKQENYYARRTF